MDEHKTRYTKDELKVFEELIHEKLDIAKGELSYIKESLSKANDPGTDNTIVYVKVLEDGASTAEKENLNQLAFRQQKFIRDLENALIRIKNGTYGVCVDTGKLIRKKRLLSVPHTTHSIDAKEGKKEKINPSI